MPEGNPGIDNDFVGNELEVMFDETSNAEDQDGDPSGGQVVDGDAQNSAGRPEDLNASAGLVNAGAAEASQGPAGVAVKALGRNGGYTHGGAGRGRGGQRRVVQPRGNVGRGNSLPVGHQLNAGGGGGIVAPDGHQQIVGGDVNTAGVSTVRRKPYVQPVFKTRANIKIPPPTIRLDGSNTNEWRAAALPYLTFNGTMYYINHDLRPEADDPSYADWEYDEEINVAVIMNLIHHEFQSRFYGCKTASEIWQLAIADASSEVVRVDTVLKNMDELSAEELDASVFVNKWTLALRTYCELGNV